MSVDYGEWNERLSAPRAAMALDDLVKQLETLQPLLLVDIQKVLWKGWRTIIPVYTQIHPNYKWALQVSVSIMQNHTDRSLSIPRIGMYKESSANRHRSLRLHWDEVQERWIWDGMKLLAKVWEVHEGTSERASLYLKAGKMQQRLRRQLSELLEIESSEISFPEYQVASSEITVWLQYDWGHILMRYDDPMFFLQGIYPRKATCEPLAMYRGDLMTMINFIGSSWRNNG